MLYAGLGNGCGCCERPAGAAKAIEGWRSMSWKPTLCVAEFYFSQMRTQLQKLPFHWAKSSVPKHAELPKVRVAVNCCQIVLAGSCWIMPSQKQSKLKVALPCYLDIAWACWSMLEHPGPYWQVQTSSVRFCHRKLGDTVRGLRIQTGSLDHILPLSWKLGLTNWWCRRSFPLCKRWNVE